MLTCASVGYVEFKDEESVQKPIGLTGQKLLGILVVLSYFHGISYVYAAFAMISTACRKASYKDSSAKTFAHHFHNDSWHGRPLNSDDDKCLARGAYSHGWKIVLQFVEKAAFKITIEITVENDIGFLCQCLRWA